MNRLPKNKKSTQVYELYTSYLLHLQNSTLSHIQVPREIEKAQKTVWNRIEPTVQKLSEDSPLGIAVSKTRIYAKNMGFALAGGVLMWALLFFLYPQQRSTEAVVASDIEFTGSSMEQFQPLTADAEPLQFELPQETEFIINGSPILYSR